MATSFGIRTCAFTYMNVQWETRTFCSWQAFHFDGVKQVNLDLNFKILKKCQEIFEMLK